MTSIYLKGYYGYKNLGDELLLLGMIRLLSSQYGCASLCIETPDAPRLETWIQRHRHHLPDIHITYATGVIQSIRGQRNADMIVIGGGEVVTDARSFPHNGRNYLLRNYPYRLVGKKIILVGGFGTASRGGTGLLHRLLYSHATQIICREQASYERVCQVVDATKVIQHQDLAYKILATYHPKISNPNNESTPLIINCNPYIWSDETRQRIVDFVKSHGLGRPLIYLPAELHIDQPMYEALHSDLPTLERYDWTQDSLQQITSRIAGAHAGIAARLHVLIMLDHYGIPYTPLVYQEKITKILGHA